MLWFRKQIDLRHLPNTHPRTLRRLSDNDLFAFIAGWKEGSADWAKGQAELRRRENWTARAALVISIAALIVAALKP